MTAPRKSNHPRKADRGKLLDLAQALDKRRGTEEDRERHVAAEERMAIETQGQLKTRIKRDRQPTGPSGWSFTPTCRRFSTWLLDTWRGAENIWPQIFVGLPRRQKREKGGEKKSAAPPGTLRARRRRCRMKTRLDLDEAMGAGITAWSQ